MVTPPYLADLFGAAVVLLLLGASLQMDVQTPGHKRFSWLLATAAALQALDAGAWLLANADSAAARLAQGALNVLLPLLEAIFGALWLAYTDAWTQGSDKPAHRRLSFAAAPIALLAAFLSANAIFAWLPTDAAIGVRAAVYLVPDALLLLYGLGAMLLTLVRAASGRDRATARRMRRTSLYLLFPIAAVLLQYTYPAISLLWPVASLGLLIIFIRIQQRRATEQQLAMVTQEQRSATLENELTQNRVAIMLSQIQPHFLYNALTTIVDLCDTDAQLAKRATIAFSQYLRANMDSLKLNKPVPFAVERTHIENYLWLEKLRFGEELTIRWDVAASDFVLPALSVQPLVENAVKYGVGKKPGGGTVTIKTRETPFGYLVTVHDDGVGFDPSVKPADGRSHVGIDSVRSRLHYQCGGALTVESVPGVGTTATITLLKERKQEETTA